MVFLVLRTTREWLSAKAFFRTFCESALFLNHRGSRDSGKATFRKCAQHKGWSFAVIHPELQVWNETWDVFLHSCMLFLSFVNILCYTWNLHQKKKESGKTTIMLPRNTSSSPELIQLWLLINVYWRKYFSMGPWTWKPRLYSGLLRFKLIWWLNLAPTPTEADWSFANHWLWWKQM